MNEQELAHYSRALDEIYRLRLAMAYEARALEVHANFKTFPKSRRLHAAEQVRRMRDAAIGQSADAYHGLSASSMRREIREVGGSETLTRSEWEQEA